MDDDRVARRVLVAGAVQVGEGGERLEVGAVRGSVAAGIGAVDVPDLAGDGERDGTAADGAAAVAVRVGEGSGADIAGRRGEGEAAVGGDVDRARDGGGDGRVVDGDVAADGDAINGGDGEAGVGAGIGAVEMIIVGEDALAGDEADRGVADEAGILVADRHYRRAGHIGGVVRQGVVDRHARERGCRGVLDEDLGEQGVAGADFAVPIRIVEQRREARAGNSHVENPPGDRHATTARKSPPMGPIGRNRLCGPADSLTFVAFSWFPGRIPHKYGHSRKAFSVNRVIGVKIYCIIVRLSPSRATSATMPVPIGSSFPLRSFNAFDVVRTCIV